MRTSSIVWKAWLFGSVARGVDSKHSDVDVAVLYEGMATLTSFRRVAPYVIVGLFLALVIVSFVRRETEPPATPVELARSIQKLQESLPRQAGPNAVLEAVSLDGRVVIFKVVLSNFRGPESMTPTERQELADSILRQVRANRQLVALTKKYDLRVRYNYLNADQLPITTIDVSAGDL